MGESGFTTRWEIDRLLSQLPLDESDRATIDRLLEGAASRFELPQKAEQPVSLAGLARDLYKLSANFRELIGTQFASNPVFDMLLDLVIAAEEGTQVSVTSLCIASGEPTTSALRHISRMEQLGLVTRVADEIDHRRSWVSLTEQARLVMQRTLADLYVAGTREPSRRWPARRRD